MLDYEEPRIYEHDIFGFNRSFTGYALCKVDGMSLYKRHPGNVTVNYALLMGRGFHAVLAEIEDRLPNAEGDQLGFLTAAAGILQSAIAFSDRYREAAKLQGKVRLYKALCNIPRNRPASFYEACIFQKLLIFLLRITWHSHVTLGRFDQYMYPFFQADLDRGVPESELFETLELYFLSLNVDSDTYDGVQQGDNGQSMVLGGMTPDGQDGYNLLSEM